MFGHTGWSALQYAGTFYDIRSRTSTTSGSFESTSTSSMYDENTPPTTAVTQQVGFDLSPPIVFENEIKTQKRGKGTFLNHTPRSYETQTPRTMDAHGSLGHFREKYSCHRMFGCAMRKASREVLGELPQQETRHVGDVAVFGVTQEYLDSQYASYAAEESDMREALPALLYRGPKSVTPSGFPFHITSSLPTVGEDGSLNQGQDALSRKIHIQNAENKVREPKHLHVGKSGQTAHPPVGRLAPPILSHEALTANANLGLNDLSYYLKHTGPSPTESKHPKLHQRKRSIKFFRAKERKKQAPAHGGGSPPQGLAKQTPINPAWVREMKTSGGVRHLRIVIPPTENECDMTVEPVPALPVQIQQHTRHVSSNGFEEDTLCPPENSAVHHVLYGSSEAAMRSFSEPHMTYQEQTQARKRRDSQHDKRKLVPDNYYSGTIKGKYRDSFVDVRACTTDAFHDAIMHAHHDDDEGFEEEDSVRRTERLEERVMLLQRQNMRLMEALAKIVGVVLEHDDLDCETMMRASLRA
ncbi:hypothetical protein COCHEDRAFT_1167136 [Bipolaris maydis C5]|uniref:Uncharacterized protein n=1 Tax=Cochliobolus heterostrophus (strain C5 / ATCC 48332 / race O) TaxID=701091 RepID=M2V8X1_COCH5|nr:hypothetical protein COCHEDRAFT_1167136 [Bipolaris maydis C5]